MHVNYDKAVVLPPIQPDDPNHGKPSDHKVAIARANRDASLRRQASLGQNGVQGGSPPQLISLGLVSS